MAILAWAFSIVFAILATYFLVVAAVEPRFRRTNINLGLVSIGLVSLMLVTTQC